MQSHIPKIYIPGPTKLRVGYVIQAFNGYNTFPGCLCVEGFLKLPMATIYFQVLYGWKAFSSYFMAKKPLYIFRDRQYFLLKITPFLETE